MDTSTKHLVETPYVVIGQWAVMYSPTTNILIINRGDWQRERETNSTVIRKSE